MKIKLFVLLYVFSIAAFAQKISIKGQLTDSLNNPMPSATLLLLSVNDSSLVNFGSTDNNGFFELKNVNRSSYIFKATFVGLASHTTRIVTPTDGNVLDLGQIKMLPANNELNAIEIEGDRAPVTIKKDTIEFNAGSFKTNQNAVVEDLLKKLPGVEVDYEGNITAHGEQVRKVTVDGKNFFGNDPKIASKNLPADAVDKVQVFDKKSDQATFTGIDDGQSEKTINLQLKPEKRNAFFGNAMAGAGTENRFQSRASLNRFSKQTQFSVLGMGNNVNEQGFSMEEYMNFTGGSQQMMTGGPVRISIGAENDSGVPMDFGNRANGIMTNYASGANINHEFSKRTEINGSYFFNYLDHDKTQSTVRQNFIPGSSFNFNQYSTQQNSNTNHRTNLSLENKIDSTNSIKLTANISYNETTSDITNNSETLKSDSTLQNTSTQTSLSSGSTATINSLFLWRHRFKKKGRTLSTNLAVGYSESDRDGFNQASNHFYQPEDSIASFEQQSQYQTTSKSFNPKISYTEPLGKRRYLEASYSFRQNENSVIRDVFDIHSDDEVYNENLSTDYNSDYLYHNALLNFRISRNKYNLVLGSAIQQSNLSGVIRSQNVNIDRTFKNVLPSIHFDYDFTNSRNFRFDYETTVQQPNIQQLQPVIDNSDPLNLYVGNPNLRPAYVQNVRFNFRSFDPTTFRSFFAFVDIDHISNDIVEAQSIDEQFGRTITPVNVKRSVSINSNTSVGIPISKLGSRINIGASLRNQQRIAMINDRENNTNLKIGGGSVSYTYRYKEIFEINIGTDIERQKTSYEFDQPDQVFANNSYTADSFIAFLKNYQLTASFDFLKYKNLSTGFDQTLSQLDISLSRFVMKNKAGELKVSANNLLNNTQAISQTASINYTEKQTTNILGRYFMISFTYALNKQLNPMGFRRGGMMRVIR